MNILVIILAYLIGSIPTAYLAARLKSGQDIRQMGSKNMGATNAFKSLGAKYGIVVFVIDFLKGIAALALALYVFTCPAWIVAAAGAVATLGHNYPVWLGFKGGKGAATAGGVLILYCLSQMLFWQLSVCLIIVIIGYFIFKNLVAGSTVAFIMAPFVFFISGQTDDGLFALILLIIIAIKFIPAAWVDIKRIFDGRYF